MKIKEKDTLFMIGHHKGKNVNQKIKESLSYIILANLSKSISGKSGRLDNCIFMGFFFILTFTCNNSKAQSKWVAPKEANTVKNPLAGKTETLGYAKVIYATYCGPCHGNKGKGDGVAGASLSKKPADHTSSYVQNQSDGALFWMITTGNNPMPSYKTVLTDIQRWELINYIRSLASNKK